jgi:ABC-type transport system substrate-binding protein
VLSILLTAQGTEKKVFARSLERVCTVEPHLSQSTYDARVIGLLYETPLSIDYKARPYRLMPGICELPEKSPDGLTYIFKMVPDTVITAKDVVRTMKILADPATASPGGWLMDNVASFAAENNKVIVRLKKKNHIFPWLMAMNNMAVKDKNGRGTGPYKLKLWHRNHMLVFEKNLECRFWKTNSNPNGFDEIRYMMVGDVSTQWLMFLKGETKFLGEISRDNWDAVVDGEGELSPELTAKGIRIHGAPMLDVRYVGFNMKDKVVGKNKALRQALTSAFDFEAWKKFYNNRIDYIAGPVPTTVDGSLMTPAKYPFDLKKARELMIKAGYPNGIDPKTGKRLVITLLLGRATQDARESGELLASFFAKIGVKLELQFCTWSAFLKAINEGRMQLYTLGWVGDYPDAENFLQLFHSSRVSPGSNHSFYMNPEYDRYFDAALNADDDEERRKCWYKCQEILREDCPWIVTHSARSYALVHSSVGNYVLGDFPYGDEKYYECEKGKEIKRGDIGD